MVSALFEYHSVVRNFEKMLANVNKQAIAKRETEYYKNNIKNVKTVDDLLNNSRLYRYVMQAYGLDDVIYAKGMVRKLLTDADYAARIKDPKFQKLSENFNFITFKDKATSFSGATKETVERYKEMALERQVGKVNDAARQGLYFNRRIKELMADKKITKTSWPYVLLADKTLSKMIFKALGMPDSIQAANVDAKAQLLVKHFSFKDLTDDSLREKIVSRALVHYDMQNGSQNMSAGAAALKILKGCNTSNFTSSLINLRYGGR